MTFNAGKFAAALLLAAGSLALVAAAKPAPKPVAKSAARNWNTAITVTPEGGYLRGNPNAGVKLVEFISYTCPHCAHFEVEADGPLQLGFVGTGKGSVEVRPFYRNPIDVAASLLATCGGTAKFFGNHAAILRAQGKWLRQPTQAELQRWSNPDFTIKMRAIAADLGLYALMEGRGYGRPQLDKCLADRALADRMANQTNADAQKYDIPGTPSFLVNGELQRDVYSWASLQPRLRDLTK